MVLRNFRINFNNELYFKMSKDECGITSDVINNKMEVTYDPITYLARNHQDSNLSDEPSSHPPHQNHEPEDVAPFFHTVIN